MDVTWQELEEAVGDSLPSSWQWTTLGEIGAIASGGTPKTANASNFDGDIPWITPADLSNYNNKYIENGRRNITQEGLLSSSAKLLPAGTILFSSRAPVGYVVIARKSVSTNQGFKNLTAHPSIFNEYVYHYLKGSKRLAESYASGTTFLELSAGAFSRLPIPVPPLNEQHRIVAKIEELFTKLEAGVAALKKTQALLKRYRQAVLKAAVEGELSRAWREANPDVEPAEKLLERILLKRYVKWEKEEQQRLKLKGKKLIDNKWKDKYVPPEPFEDSGESRLPIKWTICSLSALCSDIGDVNHKMPKAQREGIPYVSTKDFTNTGINFEATKLISQDDYRILCEKIWPERNDILLSRYGTVGQVRLVAESREFQASYSIAILKPADVEISPYLALALQGEFVQLQVRKHTRATAQPDLGLKHIRTFAIPLPPFEEQRYILSEVGRYLSIIAAMSEAIQAELKRSEQLRQSILKKAFSGLLVPQNPDDEPASVLLERIKAEKEVSTARGSRGGKRAKQDKLFS